MSASWMHRKYECSEEWRFGEFLGMFPPFRRCLMSELFIFTWEGEGNIILEDCDKGHILVVSWNGWSCGTSLQSKKPIRYKRDKPDSLYCTSKPMAHIRVARRRAVIRHSSVYL